VHTALTWGRDVDDEWSAYGETSYSIRCDSCTEEENTLLIEQHQKDCFAVQETFLSPAD